MKHTAVSAFEELARVGALRQPPPPPPPPLRSRL